MVKPTPRQRVVRHETCVMDDDGVRSRARPEYETSDRLRDGRKIDPIDTLEHVRAAWSDTHRADDAAKYGTNEVQTIKGRIERAAGEHGVEISED
jgi:hypothetical protein